jgi:hypothetical protein
VWARSDRALEDGSFGGVARRQSRAQSQLVHTVNPKAREHTEVAAGVSLEVAGACSVRAADARRREEIKVRWGDTLDHGETNVRYVCLQVRRNQVDGAGVESWHTIPLIPPDLHTCRAAMQSWFSALFCDRRAPVLNRMKIARRLQKSSHVEPPRRPLLYERLLNHKPS